MKESYADTVDTDKFIQKQMTEVERQIDRSTDTGDENYLRDIGRHRSKYVCRKYFHNFV